MEYKCDICGAPATVHITKIIDGKKIKMHLCAACAEKNSALASAGFPADIIPNIKKLEEQLLSAGNASKADLICPSCGTSFEEFEKRGRFSCPACYEAFRDRLTEILAQMHGAINHVGKRPKCHSKPAIVEDSRQIEIPFDKFEESGGNLPDEPPEAIGQSEPLKPESKEASAPETLESLKTQLDLAIADERYEDAAVLRDKINALKSEQ